MDNNLDHRIFLLSPAYAGGERARMILSDGAQFELARKLRGKSGAPIADVFTFLSGIATRKYVDVLLANFRGRLRFPAEFVGRGDMSRGGLMLRCAVDRQELSYIAAAGAILNGRRPPKLAPRKYLN